LTAARADTPLVLPNALEPVPPLSSPRLSTDDPIFTEGHSLVAAGMHSVLVQHLQVLPVEQHAATIARVRNLKTRGEAAAYADEATQLLRSHEGTTRPPLTFSATTLNFGQVPVGNVQAQTLVIPNPTGPSVHLHPPH